MNAVETALWRAFEVFRDTSFSGATVRNGLTAIVILKYVSDSVRDESAAARKRFVVPEGASLYHLSNQHEEQSIADQLDTALRAIEQANPETLGGLFDEVHFKSWIRNAHDERSLRAVVDLFRDERMDLGPSRMNSEALAGSFALLLSLHPFSSPSHLGSLYTPRQISRLMTEIMAPRPGDSVYDPVCGSAGLLLESARYIREHHHSDNYALYGQEADRSAWKVARINALFHGEDRARIELGDTLRNPRFHQGDELQRFQVVVSNPPFSLSEWGWETAESDRFNRFGPDIPPKSRGDYAFILHSIASTAKPDGRVAIVAPQGVLFRGGSEAAIRRNLIERNLLDAVIGLPPKIFYNSAISAVILVFRHLRADDAILFIDASQKFEAGRKYNSFRDADIDKLVSIYRQRSAEQGYSRLVPRGEIRANEFNLNISRYVSQSQPQPVIDMSELANEARVLGAELETLRHQIDATLQKLLPADTGTSRAPERSSS
jgi:type I restriction enzyme M protein